MRKNSLINILDVRVQRGGKFFLETVIPGKVNIVPSVILKFQGILSHSWTVTDVKNRVDKAVRNVEAKAVCLRKK